MIEVYAYIVYIRMVLLVHGAVSDYFACTSQSFILSALSCTMTCIQRAMETVYAGFTAEGGVTGNY